MVSQMVAGAWSGRADEWLDRGAGQAPVGQLDIGVLIVDDERRVVIANETVCGLVRSGFAGTPGNADDGRTVLLGAPAAVWAALPALAPFAAAMADVGSVRATLPDGRVRQGTWHAVPSGLMLTVHDLPAGAPAEVGPGTTRTELVPAVLHELRTPLTTLASTIEHLPEPDAETAPLYAVIRRTTDRMRDVLAELASVADLESGGARLDHSRVDLGRIVTETVGTWQRRDDVEVTVLPEVSGAGLVDGDAHWLRVMVDRLIAVAVTAASPRQPVTVTATGTPAGWTLSLPVDGGLAGDRLFTRTGERSNATALMLARAVVIRHGGGLTTSDRDGRVELCATVPARAGDVAGVVRCMNTEGDARKA